MNVCLSVVVPARQRPWLSLWESWLPRQGQSERVRRHNYPIPTLNRGTLSVSLFG